MGSGEEKTLSVKVAENAQEGRREGRSGSVGKASARSVNPPRHGHDNVIAAHGHEIGCWVGWMRRTAVVGGAYAGMVD